MSNVGDCYTLRYLPIFWYITIRMGKPKCTGTGVLTYGREAHMIVLAY